LSAKDIVESDMRTLVGDSVALLLLLQPPCVHDMDGRQLPIERECLGGDAGYCRGCGRAAVHSDELKQELQLHVDEIVVSLSDWLVGGMRLASEVPLEPLVTEK
jgi:hypothetical protein